MYELNVQAIRKFDTQGNGTDIKDVAQPQINGSDSYVSFLYNLIQSSFGALESWSYQGERELVLAFGEEEIKATIGASQNIRFENIEHLGGLSPDDYLSLRLYANNDTANALWEFAFGSDLLGQSPVNYISVDRRDVELLAYLPIAAQDEEHPKNIKVSWSVTGGGQLANKITDSSAGLFHNKLTASTKAGAEHVITAKVIASDDERVVVGTELTYGSITVLAGEPKTIKLSSADAILLSSGVDKTTITGEIFDQYNNPVQEGTPVSWNTGYSGELQRADSSVGLGGKVTAEYTVGRETLPTEIILSTGGVNSQVVIEKKALELTASLSAGQFSPGQTGTISVTLNQAPQEPLEVNWNNSAGSISGPAVVTGTTVQAQFKIDNDVATDGHIAVSIGGVSKDLNYSVIPGDPEGSIQFDYASIALGEQSVYQVETLQGEVAQPVVQSTNATVYGTPNTSVTLSAGGFFTQNVAPVALFPMAGFDVDDEGRNVQIDTIGGLKARVEGSVGWDETDSYFKPGSSIKFSGGRLFVVDDDSLDFNTDYYASIRFKVTSLSSEALLFRKGSNNSNGYELRIVTQDGVAHLQARVSTDQGDFTVVSSNPVEVGAWYLAGLQLKKGLLTLGMNAGRDTVAAPGLPNNSGFANNLIIGEGLQGNISELKLGQIHASRGSLVLIDGELEKTITFDQTGKARVSISGGTAKLNALGARVGFTITKDSGVAQAEEQELRYRRAFSRLTLFGNPVDRVYAESSQLADEYEGGVAVVDGQAMAEAIEMLKQAGKTALDALKTATQFLFEMTSISDIYQLGKAIYLWSDGRFDEVDKIELAFAGIGLTLTIITVATSVGTLGTGAPGSIAAMVSVKGALAVLKKTLKEVFVREPVQILKIGGTIVRWSFKLLVNIFSGKEGREKAIKQLMEFKDVFIDLIKENSLAAWGLLRNIGGSARGFIAFINIRKLKYQPCIVYNVTPSNDYQFARLTPMALAVSSAYAAPLCGIDISNRMESLVKQLAMEKAEAMLFARIIERATRAADAAVGGLKMSAQTVDNLAEFVKAGRGESILKFLDNMENLDIKAMGGFRFENMSKVLADGETAFDKLIDAMRYIPEANQRQAFNQLAAPAMGNIRGIYGEAAMFKRMKASPNLPRENPLDGFVRVTDPDNLKVGDMVPINGVMKQGIDAEGAFLEGLTESGGPLFIEVKNYTSLYKLENLRTQVAKHFDTKILDALNDGRTGWEKGKPHLHFEWMGDGFSKEVSLAARKKAVLDICGEYLKLIPLVKPEFNCKKDITFHVVGELIDPLTSKVN
ncbi:hypothetical protein [Pseudomonas sp. PIC25]|uniref:hypothetical protein n=1 Tax=Pseudomonas sp. PIC25 TaxID=1958773 RepID=UPI001C494208|nr:hypothetical protein [Pseudomonas sp. PIC25]